MLRATCRLQAQHIGRQNLIHDIAAHLTRFGNRTFSTAHLIMADKKDSQLVDGSSKDFLQKAHNLMVEDSLVAGTDRSRKVIEYKSPDELKSSIDFSFSDDGTPHDEMLELFRQTSALSVQTAHPRYFNQLYSGRNLECMAASWLTDALNANVHTYECAPVFTLAELHVIEEVCKILGFENGDGVIAAGGSMCNFLGIHLARYTHDKRVKERGMHEQPRQILFASSDAHYSVSKAAHFLGFGTDNVVFVDTDDLGRMLPEDLENKIKQCKDKGYIPLCTIATSGSTVLGSFDSLGDLADVCHKYGCWLHVDACWGGGVYFSPNHKQLMAGVEKTDSVAISFHKLMGAQIQCAAVLVREKDKLRECNAIKASYLFQPDKDYYDPFYDIGTMTVQCGRRADGYKMWAMWKSRGNKGMQEHVDKAFESAKCFTEKLKSREGFKLVLPTFQYVNISFWYIPPSLRGQEETKEWWQKVAKVAPTVKSRMIYSGSMAIGYQPMESKGFVNFFRIILDNPLTNEKDLDFVLDEIERLASDL